MQAFSQEPKEITKLLQGGNYLGLSPYVDSVAKASRSGWSVNVDETRPLFGDVTARLLAISELTEYDGPGNINNHLVQLITKSNQIVYYYLETTYFEHKDQKLYSMKVIDTFKNSVAYNKVFQDYKNAYQISLSETELWSREVMYAWSCGIAGEPTEQAKAILTFIKNKQVDSIRLWLRSPVIAKQLFAMDAFRMLGTRYLSKEDRLVIKVISAKTGNISVCNGCIVSRKSIEEIVDDIHLNNGADVTSYTVMGLTIFASAIFLLIRRRRATLHCQNAGNRI